MQVTSVVPAGGQTIGAQGSELVSVPQGGSVTRPVATRRIVATDGPAYDLRVNAAGGADYLSTRPGQKTAEVWHEAGGSAVRVGSGPVTAVGLFEGRGGHNQVVGASSLDAVIGSVSASELPEGAQIVSLSGTAAFGPSEASRGRAGAPETAAAAQSLGADGALVESTRTHKRFTAANAHVTQASSESAAPSSQRTGARPSDQGAAPQSSLPTTPTGKGRANSPAVSTQTGPLAPALTQAATGAGSPKCGVARLTPTLEAMQPSNAQVDWATDMAEQGFLKGQFARPANFANMGLVSYSPSSDFSPTALTHPAGDSWNSVPRLVMLAIEAQESNFNQASWHALPGLAGDPLIANYYGAGDSITTIDYQNADCGYGIAQVTNGMSAGDTWLSAHGQMKVATDFEENIAAGLNILQDTWNELAAAGITANNADPRYLENWYMAAWAYNSGIEPTAAFGNTTGCTPSATCTGTDGTWGLGWANNPANPDYDPSRSPYLRSTYADAAHPSSWPYQERIMGWMGSSIIRYSYIAYESPSYHGGNTWLQIAPFNAFCSSSNDCTAASKCTLSDSECWWHEPVSWISDCASTCATSDYQTTASTPMPSYTARYSPTCNADRSMIPAGAVVVSVLSDIADNDEGCSSQNWSDGGTFSYSPGTNSAGDPIGDVDTHQLGSGFDGYVLFTHTEPASSTSVINKGTWTPNLPSLQYYKVMVHLPASGAAATDVVYTINPGGGASAWKIRVNQDWGAEEWVPIATVAMENGGSVSLTNASSMSAGDYDVAFDSVAFVPEGGSPGHPIGGPPTVRDEPAGSNPSLVECGCAVSLAGDPVDTATGAFTQSATDLSVPGIGEPLGLTRTYTSSLADPSGSDPVSGAFGPGWTYSYGLSAATDASTGDVTITQEDGSQVVFTDTSGVYAAPARYDATLTHSGSAYTFTRHGADQFVFDVASGRLTGESDQAGRAASPAYQTSLAYNGSGQLATVTDPAGRTLTFTWSGAHISSVVDTAGRRVDYAYDTAGDLTDVYGVATTRTGGVEGNQDHTVYGYTAAHLMSTMTSAADQARTGTPHTTMTYDSSDRVISQTDPAGKVTGFDYGPDSTTSLTAGQTLVTDPAGHKTLYGYTDGLETSRTAGYGTTDASTWTYAYDPLTLGVAMQTNPDGSTQTYSYDAAGHKVSASDPLGHTTSYQYNAAGQVTETIDPTGTRTQTDYNSAGAPTQVGVGQDGQSAESANDTLNPSFERQTTYQYGNATLPGLTTSRTSPAGGVTSYGYDTDGNLASVTDPLGDVTKYGYNTARGLRTSAVSPRGVAAGTATGCSPPATGCTTYTYDAAADLTATTDSLGHVASTTWDADGDQTATTDADGQTTTTGYDADDRPVTVTQPSGAASTTAYNGDGTVASTTDANGKVTSYTYNAQGQQLSSTDPDGATTTVARDAMGRVDTSTAPSGAVTTSTWDAGGNLTSVSYSDGTHGAGYTWDADGRLTSMSDGTGTSTYSYDVFGELTSETDGAGAATAYSYDADGDTTGITYPGGAGTVARAFNAADQLASVTIRPGEPPVSATTPTVTRRPPPHPTVRP